MENLPFTVKSHWRLECIQPRAANHRSVEKTVYIKLLLTFSNSYLISNFPSHDLLSIKSGCFKHLCPRVLFIFLLNKGIEYILSLKMYLKTYQAIPLLNLLFYKNKTINKIKKTQTFDLKIWISIIKMCMTYFSMNLSLKEHSIFFLNGSFYNSPRVNSSVLLFLFYPFSWSPDLAVVLLA